MGRAWRWLHRQPTELQWEAWKKTFWRLCSLGREVGQGHNCITNERQWSWAGACGGCKAAHSWVLETNRSVHTNKASVLVDAASQCLHCAAGPFTEGAYLLQMYALSFEAQFAVTGGWPLPSPPLAGLNPRARLHGWPWRSHLCVALWRALPLAGGGPSGVYL